MTTLQQRLKAAQNIKRMRQVHEYYMDNPDATINKASAFIPESRAMCYKYSKIRTECLTAINAVIDMRYYHRGAQWTKVV